jgi:signal transduction histidine kinase
MGTALGRARTADELLTGLVQSVGEALRLESVAVHLGTAAPDGGADDAPAAVWGVPTSRPFAVPLETQGEVLGRLEVTAPPGESLDARDRRALDELTGVVAAGVALARATDELERARDRLAVVRLEERRVLRRELHDGLGPSLAGVRLGLSGARNLLERNPAAAGELLSTLQAELDQRVDDVRALSHSLLPPALDDLGLEAALEELAARHRMGGLDVTVACSGAGGLEPVTAVAVYGIVVEAVINVSRHSGSTVAFVTVDVGESAVTVTVDDAGTGIPDGAVPGVGTRSMRERAEEQGGTLQMLALEGGGTRVAAMLPVGSR